MIRVAVTGAAGRMGSGIIRKITEQDDMEVVAAIEMPNTQLLRLLKCLTLLLQVKMQAFRLELTS